MMINGITSYTPNRQAQKVNFGSVKVSNWVKEHCGLTDEDISELNKMCPHPEDIDIKVVDDGTDGDHIEVCRAEVWCQGRHNATAILDKTFDVYYNVSDKVDAQRRSKENFMKAIIPILNNKILNSDL